MAIEDRVQPLKLEDPSTGGEQTDFFPTAMDRNKDYIDCRGLTLQDGYSDDPNVRIERDSTGDLVLADSIAGPHTLSSLLLGGAKIHASYFDVALTPPTSEILGTVSGLSPSPAKVLGFESSEYGPLVQSGLVYSVRIVSLTQDGFNYQITVADDEWWPGPGPITLRTQYIWSEI